MSVAPQVTVSTGIVRGEALDGVRRYLGIPYAASPFGPNRFRGPQPAPAWEGVRDATAFGPTAPQHPYPGTIGELLGSVEIPGDEILSVNIWAPDDAAGAPVVLWIHGGALERGTAALPLYDGAAFARAGIVFASINYRLGSEGFSVLDGAPRNLGLQDAAAGLAWVHSEIASFGGDPSQITAMGESAGGAIVAGLLANPSSRSLIARAIIESGPLEAQTAKKAGRVTAQLATGRRLVSAGRGPGVPVRAGCRFSSPLAARGPHRHRRPASHREQHGRVSPLVPSGGPRRNQSGEAAARTSRPADPADGRHGLSRDLPRSLHGRDLRPARHGHHAARAADPAGPDAHSADVRLRVRLAESGPRPACSARPRSGLRVRSPR